MEMFSAGNRKDLEVIREAIDQCDIYMVIVGAYFGSVIDDKAKEKKSYTQIEFEYAQSKGKPILGFILDEAEYKTKRDELESNNVERSYEDSLREFRKEVKDEEFKAEALGLIANDPESVSLGTVINNPFLWDIIDKLKDYTILTERCNANLPKTIK